MRKYWIKQIADEPYRVFFPVALVVGMIGALLWPLYYAGGLAGCPDWLKLPFYPKIIHSYLMIEGFVGGFAVGFVGTALPKLMSAKPLNPWQVMTLLVIHLACCTCHLFGVVRMGNALFALMVGGLLVSLFFRLLKGKQVPPPSMLLATMGLLSGTLSALWLAWSGENGGEFGYLFAHRLLYQSFILLPLLGIGGYIFPMILGTTNRQSSLSGPNVTRAWNSKAFECVVLGGLLILTYWIEVQSEGGRHGYDALVKNMSWVRFVLCFVWLLKESEWLRRTPTKGVMAFGLRAGIVCVLGGMITVGIWQEHRVALEHSLYIGGFGLITMIVAARVLFAHSGQVEKLQLWSKPLTFTVGLLLLTMLTRVSADFIPKVTISHHVYAAVLWVIISIIWGVALLPSVKKIPPQPVISKKKKNTVSLMDMDFRK